MGQLEKYGLYVLCLVIFLILGVTIWGGGDLPVTAKSAQSPIVAPGNLRGPGDAAGSVVAPLGDAPNLADLLRPTPGSNDPKKSEAKKVEPKKPAVEAADAGSNGKVDGTARDAGANGVGDRKELVAGARPTYKVKSGDTFEGIAKQKLGNAALKVEIARLNPRVEASRLQVGQDLQLPTAAEIAQLTGPASSSDAVEPVGKGKGKAEVVASSAKESRGTYLVKKGDTFEGIASAQLGSKKRSKELQELNPGIKPEGLRIGTALKLPK